ncbi:MAG: hypothetical protein V4858_03830 [Pseudomonadota bacterium]
MSSLSGCAPTLIARFLSTLLLVLVPLAHAGDEAIAGYSKEPLRAPLFDEAQIAAETMAINNWLNANIQKLTYDQMKGPREHLYDLIDSRVKQHYASEQRVLPKKHDLMLEILFSWAEPLGGFGGSQIFNSVKAGSSPTRTPGMKLPEGLSISLAKDLLTVQSSAGWSVSFPYYFMIWNVGDFTAKGGPRTQLVALSTGAAKDSSQAGKSQATLMFMFSPDEYRSFESYWRRQLGIGAEIKSNELGVKSLSSRHIVDAPTKLHKEFTSWSNPTGSFAVAYLGIEGTYEWNRPHFIDFLRVVAATKSESRPDNVFTGGR